MDTLRHILIGLIITVAIFFLVWLIDRIFAYNSHQYVESIFLEEQNISYETMINKCKYPLWKISRAFGQMESGNCSFWASIESNNCWSLHPWWTKQLRWKANKYWWTKSFWWERLNLYGRMTAADYDFMATYYYSYWCKIDLNHIHYYIYWKNKSTKSWNHARQYYKNLLNNINN